MCLPYELACLLLAAASKQACALDSENTLNQPTGNKHCAYCSATSPLLDLACLSVQANRQKQQMDHVHDLHNQCFLCASADPTTIKCLVMNESSL